MTKQRAKKQERKLKEWLSQGGEAQLRRSAVAEIYELEGPERKRSSAAGSKTIVRPLLDPRLKLSPMQRAIGNAYGAYFEQYNKAGGPEWIREFVDKSTVGSTGYSEAAAACGMMVLSARVALKEAGHARYALGKSRKSWRGKHKPIPIIEIVDAVCILGRPIEFIAVANMWLIERNGKRVAPDRQRKRIAAALRDGLDAIADEWQERGFTIPAELAMIEVD